MVGDLSAYRGKRVLVTGHTGFKGSWLCEILSDSGADVIGVSDKILPSPSHHELIAPRVKSYFSDIGDLGRLMATFEAEKPEIVFHLAAQSLVRNSYLDPFETYRTNVMGTLVLFECVRRTKSVKALVNVTSDKCYENKEWIWGYRETDPMGGYDPYSSSKGCAEILHQSYQRSFFNPGNFGINHNCLIASVRSGNVIGGGDWAIDRLIPDMIRALTTNSTLLIRNPGSTRPWQHVLEPLFGYLLLGSNLLQGNQVSSTSFNFGPGDQDDVSVGKIVEFAKKHFPDMKVEVKESAGNPHEANALRLDCSKARKLLGWTPSYSTEQALDLTFSWYKKFLASGEVLTKKQIHEYKETLHSRC